MAILPDEEQYTGQPWIGQILSGSTNAGTFRVQWFRGAYTTPWAPDKRYTPFDITIDSVISKVEFTPTFRLTRSSVAMLKDSLQHLDHLVTD